MYDYGYSYGYGLIGGNTYNPYINYTWEMLPNAKVKNSGTSGVDLQLYSGNPLDFQGSQAVVVDDVNSTNFDIRNDFTLLLACKPSSSNNTLVGNNNSDTKFLLVTRYIDSLGTRFIYNDTVYKFKDIETEAENLSYKCLGITKSGTTLTFYWNGEVLATYTNIFLPSSNNFTNLILGSRTAGSSVYDGAYDNFFLFDSVLDADTIKKHTEYPNDFYQDMVNDNRTLFCTDFRGTAGYIADDKNNVVGSELVVNGTFDTDLSGWTVSGEDATHTITHTINGVRYVSDTTSPVLTLQQSGILDVGQTYLIKVTTTDYISGSLKTDSFGSSLVVSNSLGTTTLIGTASATTFGIYGNSANVDITIDNISVKEISAVYPITNYSPTQRTNFRNETTGLQDLTRSFDSLGFYTGVTDYLNCNGKGYGDTGWIPSASEDWGIEIAKEFVSTSSYDLCGIASSNINERLYIGKSSSNRLYVRLGASETNTYVMFDNYVISLVYKSATKTADIYHNGVFKVTIGDGLFTTPSNSFLLTEVLNSFYSTTDIRLFKVHNKVLTQEEITNNYNDYVAQGLLQ